MQMAADVEAQQRAKEAALIPQGRASVEPGALGSQAFGVTLGSHDSVQVHMAQQRARKQGRRCSCRQIRGTWGRVWWRGMACLWAHGVPLEPRGWVTGGGRRRSYPRVGRAWGQGRYPGLSGWGPTVGLRLPWGAVPGQEGVSWGGIGRMGAVWPPQLGPGCPREQPRAKEAALIPPGRAGRKVTAGHSGGVLGVAWGAWVSREPRGWVPDAPGPKARGARGAALKRPNTVAVLGKGRGRPRGFGCIGYHVNPAIGSHTWAQQRAKKATLRSLVREGRKAGPWAFRLAWVNA